MNGENDHLFDESHLGLCPVCDKQDCVCPPEDEAEALCSQWITEYFNEHRLALVS